MRQAVPVEYPHAPPAPADPRLADRNAVTSATCTAVRRAGPRSPPSDAEGRDRRHHPGDTAHTCFVSCLWRYVMPDVLETLTVEREELDGELETINERAAAEVRKLNEAEDQQAKALLERIGIIDERVRMHVDQMEARRKNALARREGGRVRDPHRNPRTRRRSSTRRGGRRSSTPTSSAPTPGAASPAASSSTASWRRGRRSPPPAWRSPISCSPPIEVTFRSQLLEVCGRVTVSSGCRRLGGDRRRPGRRGRRRRRRQAGGDVHDDAEARRRWTRSPTGCRSPVRRWTTPRTCGR